MRKPAALFDRDWEWDVLTQFATDPTPGAMLGIVSGRRRQGKSMLLEELCQATGGFYFAATEATATDSLRLLAEGLSDHLHSPAPHSFETWDRAIDSLLQLGTERPVPVVLDEFPYLCRAAPDLPSIIQRALGPRRRQRLASTTRMVLCGSALSFMGGLLSGTAPLRGRAGLDLTVSSFDYRTAADFWGIADPGLAMGVHSIVGGTPAYRREYVRDDAPAHAGDFDDWVVRTVLNPACPLFKEARYLLAEEPDLRDTALYHSVLAAVADGKTTRGGIAAYIGRKDDTLGHPLTVLEDAGLLMRQDDAFRRGRSRYRIAEPLVAFYHAIMRPDWGRLERPGRAKRVWVEARDRYRSSVVGPHFEELCRAWARDFASDETFGGPATRVGAGVVHDSHGRTSHEIDVVVTARSGQVLSIGEAKAGEVMSTTHLDRLAQARDVLARRNDVDVSQTRLACYSARGFTAGLERRAERAAGNVVIVDIDRLYSGG
ncbi:MAG: AAA family ATPase [Acidimicrobiales bacterium]